MVDTESIRQVLHIPGIGENLGRGDDVRAVPAPEEADDRRALERTESISEAYWESGLQRGHTGKSPAFGEATGQMMETPIRDLIQIFDGQTVPGVEGGVTVSQIKIARDDQSSATAALEARSIVQSVREGISCPQIQTMRERLF